MRDKTQQGGGGSPAVWTVVSGADWSLTELKWVIIKGSIEQDLIWTGFDYLRNIHYARWKFI